MYLLCFSRLQIFLCFSFFLSELKNNNNKNFSREISEAYQMELIYWKTELHKINVSKLYKP